MLNTLILKLSDLYSKKFALELSLKDKNPLLLEIENTIQTLKRTLVENVKNIKETSNIAVLDINKRIGTIEKELSDLPRTEQQLLNIERKYKLSDKLYNYLLEKRAEAGIAGASNISDNKIVDQAVLISQTYPNTSANYLIALSMGIIIPLLIIFILDFFSNSINNHSQLLSLTTITLV